MTDSKKLLLLAKWFDSKQSLGLWPESTSHEVQQDLRRIARRLERPDVDFMETDTGDFQSFGEALNEVLRTQKATHALLHVDHNPRKPWTKGGCFVLALALKEYFGDRAQLCGLRSVHRMAGFHEHALVEVDGSGLYIDGAGVHTADELSALYPGSVLEMPLMEVSEFEAPADGVAHLTKTLREKLGSSNTWSDTESFEFSVPTR